MKQGQNDQPDGGHSERAERGNSVSGSALRGTVDKRTNVLRIERDGRVWVRWEHERRCLFRIKDGELHYRLPSGKEVVIGEAVIANNKILVALPL